MYRLKRKILFYRPFLKSHSIPPFGSGRSDHKCMKFCSMVASWPLANPNKREDMCMHCCPSPLVEALVFSHPFIVLSCLALTPLSVTVWTWLWVFIFTPINPCITSNSQLSFNCPIWGCKSDYIHVYGLADGHGWYEQRVRNCMSRLVHVGLSITSPPDHDGFTLMKDKNLMIMRILDDIHIVFHCWLWKPYNHARSAAAHRGYWSSQACLVLSPDHYIHTYKTTGYKTGNTTFHGFS